MENLPPHVLRLVYKEVSALAADPPEGIKIYPSEEDITELHTAIEGPGKDVARLILLTKWIGGLKFLTNFLWSSEQLLADSNSSLAIACLPMSAGGA